MKKFRYAKGGKVHLCYLEEDHVLSCILKRRAKFTIHNKFHSSKTDLIVLYRVLDNNEISFSQDLSYKQQKKILSLCKCKEFQKCCLEQIAVERIFDEKRFVLVE